jgi:hydrogenase maturation protease
MRTAVIGVGNPFMGDDGAGVRVLKLLDGQLSSDVEIIDLGTGGMELVHVLSRLDAAIIVDAGDFGEKPGAIRIFEPGDTKSLKKIGYSLHDWDLFTALDISSKMNELPGKIKIVAIQAREVIQTEALSEEVETQLAELAREVKQVLSSFLKCEDSN